MIRNNVSAIIGQRRMTIAETAKLAGLQYNTIYNLYYDKTAGIDFNTLDRLCFALDCTPNDLLKTHQKISHITFLKVLPTVQ